MSDAQIEYSAHGALAEIHRLLGESGYFEKLHEAESPGAVVNTCARFLKLAQIDRDEVQRLTEQKRTDAGAAALLKKIAGNIKAFDNLPEVPHGLMQIETAWGDFYEAAFNRRKAHAELADLLNDIYLDLTRLEWPIDKVPQTPDTLSRRNTWTRFYSYAHNTLKELKLLKAERDGANVRVALLEEKVKELTQQAAYEMQRKAEYSGIAEAMRDAAKMVIETAIETVASEVARRRPQ